MRNGPRILTLVVGLTLFGAAAAYAQDQVDVNASITIPTVLYVDVTNTSVTFDQPDATDYANGSIDANVSGVLSYRGNVQHSVEIAADADYFDATDAANDDLKPASHLEWSKDGGSNWSALSTTAADVVTGVARGAHDNAQTIDYRMLLDYTTDAPDTYSLGFTYTVVAD